MRWKNSAFYNKLRSFFEKELFSAREFVTLCFLSLILEMCGKILFIPILAQSESIEVQDTFLFFLSVLWAIIGVCALIFMPVMSILCIILWCLLEKNTQKLKEINQQRGKKTCQQKDRYKKSERGKIYDNTVVAIFVFVLVSVTTWFAIPMMILQLYYGVFKQVRMYCRLRKELKSVREEHNTAFEKS